MKTKTSRGWPGWSWCSGCSDRGAYDLSAEADDRVRAARDNVLGGSRNVELVLDAGLPLAGRVVPGCSFTEKAFCRPGPEQV